MDSRSQSRPNEVLVIAVAGVVLASLDLFIVNIALPKIAVDLHQTDLSKLSWVLNAYAIVYAALLVYFGRLADRYRRDRGFLLGVTVFTLASAGCAAAPDLGVLIGFRVVQAAGAALLTPTSLGLLLASFEPHRRSAAVRAWTAAGGMAAAFGPVLGGLLVEVNWRWVFLVNVPIGIASVLVGWRRLPAVAGHPVEHPDPFGAVLATVGVGALTLGLIEGSDWGWRSAGVLTALAAAAILLAAFVLHCLYSRTPLVHPDLFRVRSFTGASVVAVLFSAAFGAMLLSIVLWEQDVWHWSALRSGLAIAPGPLMVPLVSFGVAGRLIARYGPGRIITAGSVIFAASFAWWALAVTLRPDYVSGILGGMLLSGVGVGLTLPTIMATAAASLPPESFATGSAVVTMVRQTGMALGVAIIVPVLAGGGLTQFQHAWWVTFTLALLGAAAAIGLLGRTVPVPVATVPPAHADASAIPLTQGTT